MHIQIDWSSDLKLRYLCFILLCSKYTYYIYMYVKVNFCYFGWEMQFNVFWRNEWKVIRLDYKKSFEWFDIYNWSKYIGNIYENYVHDIYIKK